MARGDFDKLLLFLLRARAPKRSCRLESLEHNLCDAQRQRCRQRGYGESRPHPCLESQAAEEEDRCKEGKQIIYEWAKPAREYPLTSPGILEEMTAPTRTPSHFLPGARFGVVITALFSSHWC